MTIDWRLVVDGPGSGPWNMGVDEALLASAQHDGRATLRLYRWDGPWLSVGYGQKLSPEREAACAGAGVGVVRRSTGGLAVLHGADVTYAVAAPEAALPPGLRGSYCLVADALCAAFEALGVEIERSATCGAPGRRAGFDCFAVPAEDELVAGGRKLAGSAQRRAGGGVLQHGSVRLRPDPAGATRATGLDPDRATSLSELGGPSEPAALVDALVAGFGSVLGVSLEPEALSSTEVEAARKRDLSPPRPC